VSVDQRPASAFHGIAFIDPLKMTLPAKFGQRKAEFVPIVKLNRVHNGVQLGAMLLLWCACLSLCHVVGINRWHSIAIIFLANVPRQVSLAGAAGESQASGAKALGLLFCQQALCLSGGMSNRCSSKLPTGQRLTGRVCSDLIF